MPRIIRERTVYYKEGNKEKRKGALELSPTTARFQIEGPIRRERSSYYLATERTHYDFWAKWLLGEEGKGLVLPYLDDYYLKLHFEPSFKDKISFTAVRVGEGMDMKMEEGFGSPDDKEGHFKHGYTKDIFALNHKRVLLPHLGNELTLSYLIDKGDFDFYSPDSPWESRMRFDDTTLRNETTLGWGNHETKLGVMLSRNKGYSETSMTYTEVEEENGRLIKKRKTHKYHWDRTVDYIGAYLWDRYKFGFGPIVDYGLRYEYLNITKETLISPRFSLCLPIGRSRIKCSIGEYSQYPISEGWLDEKEGNPDLLAQRSRQHIIGYEREIGDDKRIRIEGYYNDLSRLILPDREKKYLNKGRGVTKGIELFFQKKEGGRWDGWLSYALSRSEREKVPDWYELAARVEEGRLYPIDQERPHVASLVLNFKLPRRWRLNKKTLFYSGNPYTPIVGVRSEQIDETTTLYRPIYGEYNSARLPNYFKIDLTLTRGQRWGEWYLQCLNLTDHKNVYGYYYSQDYKERKEWTMLPLMLLGGVKFIF